MRVHEIFFHHPLTLGGSASQGFALQVSGKTPVEVFKKLKFHTSKKNPANPSYVPPRPKRPRGFF